MQGTRWCEVSPEPGTPISPLTHRVLWVMAVPKVPSEGTHLSSRASHCLVATQR